jgi:hypothetical protein
LISNTDFAIADDSNPLAPGVYTSLTAIRLSGEIFLDNSDQTNEWTFNVASLATAASCKVAFKTLAGGSVTWKVNGAIALGARSEIIGNMTSTMGVITLGAKAESGDLTAKGAITLGANAESGHLTAEGAINLGAKAHSGDLNSRAAITLGAHAQCGNMKAVGAVTLGAGATVNGNIEAGGAIGVGANSNVKGQLKAGAAITVGAGSNTCALCAGAAITLGAGAAAECNLPFLSRSEFCREEATSVCTNILIPVNAYKCTLKPEIR